MNTNKFILASILVLFLILFTCREENNVFISSVDGTQAFSKEMKIDSIFINSNIDTALFKSLTTKDDFSPLRYNQYIVPDSNDYKIFIASSIDNNNEGEPSFLIIGPFRNNTIQSIYFIEIEQAFWYWEKYQVFQSLKIKRYILILSLNQ